MTTLNIEELKLTFMNTIRTYLYPQQLITTGTASLYEYSSTLSTTFSPFVTKFLSYGIYVSDKIGTPDSLVVSVYNGNSLVSYSTIASTVGWNIATLNVDDIVPSRESSIVVTSNVDELNNYILGTDTKGNLAYTIGVNDFVYKVFPQKDIDNGKLPVVVVDMDGRPKVDERYLTGDQVWYYLDVVAEVYSKRTQEIDRVISIIDNKLGVDREKFNGLGIRYISPGSISKLQYVKPEVYTRNVVWRIRMLVTREE